MEKRTEKVNFPRSEEETLMLGKIAINVKTFLSEEDQEGLTEGYLTDCSKSVLRAEMFLMAGIVDLCTDISLSDGSGALISPNDIYANFKWYQSLLKLISNYEDFRRKLGLALSEYNNQRAIGVSIGTVIDSIATEVKAFLSNLGDENFTDEKIEKIRQMVSEINDSSILKSVSQNIEKPKSKPRAKKAKGNG